MVAVLIALAAVILMTAAEILHARRVRQMASLAFGPAGSRRCGRGWRRCCAWRRSPGWPGA